MNSRATANAWALPTFLPAPANTGLLVPKVASKAQDLKDQEFLQEMGAARYGTFSQDLESQ